MTAVCLRLVLDQVLRVCAVSDHAVGSDHQAGPSCRAIGRLPTGQVNWCTRAGRWMLRPNRIKLFPTPLRPDMVTRGESSSADRLARRTPRKFVISIWLSLTIPPVGWPP